ncbi:unnamed protein product [Caenorhabditis angaria]|uniref:Uncharacterized protein n=1 Tax=Caenorhabditis angaria TaxID=860376 RepID=A0A9P1N6B3_9PELO|nr:unnamed protein product [Caenorhabditis angaria]
MRKILRHRYFLLEHKKKAKKRTKEMNIGEEQDALLESLINTKPVVRRSSEPPVSVSAQQIQAALNKERNERRRRRAEQRSYSVTRKTVSRFRSKLILFDPEEMCLCGLLSITHSVHLIVCIEIFFALVLLIQAPDLLTMDGTYFYFLGLFDGTGVFFFSLHVSVCVTCIISSGILYLGSRKQIASLILPHLLWQFSFILISLSAIITLMTLGLKGKMLLPASIVLSSMMGVAGGCEVWWCLLSLAYYRFIRDGKNHWIDDNSRHNLV